MTFQLAAVCRITDAERRKRALFLKIRDDGLLWSYAPDIEYSHDKKTLLIENILKYGDLADINAVFAVFGKREIRRIWQEYLKPDARF